MITCFFIGSVRLIDRNWETSLKFAISYCYFHIANRSSNYIILQWREIHSKPKFHRGLLVQTIKGVALAKRCFNTTPVALYCLFNAKAKYCILYVFVCTHCSLLHKLYCLLNSKINVLSLVWYKSSTTFNIRDALLINAISSKLSI